MARATECTVKYRPRSQRSSRCSFGALASGPAVRHPEGMAAAEEHALLRPVAPGAPRSQTARLARYLRTRWGLGMFAANLAGAIDVFILLSWILPTPPAPAGENLL